MKLFGLILTYNCENLIENAIKKIPVKKFDRLICVDDGSTDKTQEKLKNYNVDFFSHKHLGYGGNLFYGLNKAFELGATHVVEIHGDGQYSLNNLNIIIQALDKDKSDLVLGNRFYDYKITLKNGMPWHIFIGNIILSLIAKYGIGINLKDFFPGQRAYSKIFFNLIKKYNLPKGYQFSFEIIVLSKLHNLKINSVRTECNYKDERKTAPLFYIFSCFYHLILTIILFRFFNKKYTLKKVRKINN